MGLPLIIAGIGAAISIFSKLHQAAQLKKMAAAAAQQKSISQAAQQRSALASNLLNARMPGAVNAERNIRASEANAEANVNRTATSGSQALAVGAAIHGQTNQNIENLGVRESQDYYNRLGNQNQALAGMSQEQVRQHEEQVNLSNAYLGASMQQTQGAWNSLANFGISAAGLIGGGAGGNMARNPNANMSYMNMQPMTNGAVGNGYMPDYITGSGSGPR